MQFSEISELTQFKKPQSGFNLSLIDRNPTSYIPIQTLQDLNLFPLQDLLDNSLQPDPRFTQEKAIKLGSSNEKTEDILQEIQGYVMRSELKPLEKLMKSKQHGELTEIEHDNHFPKDIHDFYQEKALRHLISSDLLTDQTSKGALIKSSRTVAEDLVLVGGQIPSEKHEEDEDLDSLEMENRDSSSVEKDKNNEKEKSAKTITKPFSYHWIEDDSKKKFMKVDIDFEQSKGKSLLSEKIHHMPFKKMNKLSRFSLNDFFKNSHSKPVTVFFFGTPLNLKVPININSTVQEVIVSIICFFMNCSIVDHSLMNFPWLPEAYELRILEDDDDYRPEMSFDPLEKYKKFGEYGIESVVFCEIEGFKTSVVSEDNEDKEINDKFKSILDPKQLLIQISIPQQNYSTLMPIDSSKQVKDIFPIIQKKVKFNANKYKVFEEIGPNDEEGIYLAEDQEVDINMPLVNLKKNRLKLVKKTFADDGEIVMNGVGSRTGDLANSPEGIGPGSIILNEIQASKYEEFELLKINRKNNKRKIVILGISQFRIYIKNREIQSFFYFIEKRKLFFSFLLRDTFKFLLSFFEYIEPKNFRNSN